MIISGLKKIIGDKKTKKYGLQCYGIVIAIQESGTYVNGNPEYKAILDFLNPETHQVQTLEEIVGFNYNKYPINSYVSCKYYQWDINLDNIVSENEIPVDIKKHLAPVPQAPNYSSIEFSHDGEYVTIDWIQYKKNQ